MISFLVFLFCLLATYASYLLLTRKSAAQRARMNRRLAELLLPEAVPATGENVSLIKDDALSDIQFVNDWLKRMGLGFPLKHLIEQSDVQITVTRLCMFSGLAGLSAGLAVMVISDSVLLGTGGGGLAAAVPFWHVASKRKQRMHQFLADLPDALDMLSRALGAGHVFADALLLAANEVPEPVATELRRTYDEQNLGLPLEIALENLTKRIPLLELRLCITAMLVQRETGGNIADILAKVADTIRDRFRILEDLKTLTMSSRLSAWVLCGIPVFVAVVATLINPEYMQVMWFEPLGRSLIGVALALQLTGILVVRKILQIKI